MSPAPQTRTWERPDLRTYQARVTRRTLWVDFWFGWRDGRRGVPFGHDADQAEDGHSPHLRDIRRTRESHLSQLQLTYQRSLQDATGLHEELGARLEALQERIQWQLESIKDLEAAGPSTQRRMGEQGLPDNLIRRRRRREHVQTLERLRGQLTALRADHAHASGRLKSLDLSMGEFEEEFDLVREHLTANYRRRDEVYFDGARRSHPRPALLANTIGWDPSGEA